MNQGWIESFADEDFEAPRDQAREEGRRYYKQKWTELFAATNVLRSDNARENAQRLQELFTNYDSLGLYLALFQATRPMTEPDTYPSEGPTEKRSITRFNEWFFVEVPLTNEQLFNQIGNGKTGLYRPVSLGGLVEFSFPGDGEQYEFSFTTDGQDIIAQSGNTNSSWPQARFSTTGAVRRVDISNAYGGTVLLATDKIVLNVPQGLEGYRRGAFDVSLEQVTVMGKNWGSGYHPRPSWAFESLAQNFLPLLQEK